MPSTGNLKMNKIKSLPPRILQWRKVWEGVRQVQKALLSVLPEVQTMCGRDLKEGKFIFRERNQEDFLKILAFNFDLSTQRTEYLYLTFAVPGIMYSLVSKINVIPAFMELTKA